MTKIDLIIRGGTVVDGSGAAPFPADVAIDNGVIVAVEADCALQGREEIDAQGRYVTPGFVDIHTHYDGQAIWDQSLAPSSWHGVTTTVIGNCGVGFAPVRVADREKLVELMEGVEDIPGAALNEGLSWNWESFEDYLQTLESKPHDIDFCAQLPHGPLRVYVMGDRAIRLEQATDDDLAKMRALTSEAIRAGALGFTTSRTLAHRTVKGDPTPSLRANEAELQAIAAGMADAGRGVIELNSDFDTPDLESEFSMLRRVVAASGRPLSFSLGQLNSKPEKWRKMLSLIDAANADGLAIRAQVSPRSVGLLYGLQATLNPFMLHPSFKAIMTEPLEKIVATMSDPAFRAKLLAETPMQNAPIERLLLPFDRVFPLGANPNYEPKAQDCIAAIAAREGRDVLEVVYDILLRDNGRQFLFAPFSNFSAFNLDVCGDMMRNPNTLMGLGDGGAHLGSVCDASFTTYALTHWVRDRQTGRFPIETMIRKLTRQTAEAVGLMDRGLLAKGMKADVNVIDFANLQIEQPYMKFDLPAGGRRLLQKATGYETTIVSGKVIYRNGEATGQLPGRLVRGPQAAPSAA